VKKNAKFIDMFAGIGGFHEAMLKVDPNSTCVCAIEFDGAAQSVYKNSFGIDPLGDINNENTIQGIDIAVEKNDGFDILFAGFPCQTFSKAGKREGFNDETRGTLFYKIEELLKKYKPQYFVLENVRNLINHKSNNQKSLKIIIDHLKKMGYEVRWSLLSPHRIKQDKFIPQLRERVFIYGKINSTEEELNQIRKNIESKFYSNKEFRDNLPTDFKKMKQNIERFLDKDNDSIAELKIDENTMKVLNIWEELNQEIRADGGRLISPIWLDTIFNEENQKTDLEWKSNLINKNMEFYKKHKKVINKWYKKHNKLKGFNKTQRKFEWNANNTIASIFEGIIHSRPSGIRVKKPDYFPTFVAINQKPIINNKYISPNEIKKLYGFQKVKLGSSYAESYKQLGNSVSADVSAIVIKELLR
jgi:DNA (cytosine-5)-methyltransferase 1